MKLPAKRTYEPETCQNSCDILAQKHPKASGSCSDQITFVTNRSGHEARFAIAHGRIRAKLIWRPSVTVKEGIEKTVKWYLDNVSDVSTYRTNSRV